jgi:hypothetical protein
VLARTSGSLATGPDSEETERVNATDDRAMVVCAAKITSPEIIGTVAVG